MSKRILIVEDDAPSLQLMRDALQASDFETREAQDGAAAIPLAVAETVDLIVMDVGLNGINGVEAARQLRSHPLTMRLPVVVVTASAMPGDEERMLDAGCDAFLPKPLQPAQLVSVIESLLTAEGEAR